MLVEDNDDDADLVARGISRSDPDVELDRVDTIPKAISRLSTAQVERRLPDLVLVDGRIAGIDASEFFSGIEREGIRGLRSVVLTGTVELRSQGRFLELGALEVKGKPVDYAEFLDMIADILSRYRGHG
jgi:CheY-like chemotaxis protein